MEKILEIKVQVLPIELSHASLEAIAHAEEYDWILFTSKNAVQFFIRELHKGHIKLPQRPRIGAVGKTTAKALQTAGLRVDFIPQYFRVAQMVKGIGNIKGKRILFPRSAIAPQRGVNALRTRGARVKIVPLYTTVASPLPAKRKRELLRGLYTELRFKSPSGVRGLMEQLSSAEKRMVRNMKVQCIGQTTARAAKAMGFKKISITGML